MSWSFVLRLAATIIFILAIFNIPLTSVALGLAIWCLSTLLPLKVNS